MKRIWYLLLIFSYLLLGFILVYFNICNPHYEGNLQLYLSAVVIIIWVASAAELLPGERETSAALSGIDRWLRALAELPAVILVVVPIVLLFLPFLIIKFSGNSIKRSCRPLTDKGFVLTRETGILRPVYRLTRGETVIRICEYDVYEISVDGGNTFAPAAASAVLFPDERGEIQRILEAYRTADSRDSDLYLPTQKILRVIAGSVDFPR